MWILEQTARSLIDIFRLRRVARKQHTDQEVREDGIGRCEVVPAQELESAPEYGDGFIARMIQFSQMPRTRSPRDRTPFSIKPVPA